MYLCPPLLLGQVGRLQVEGLVAHRDREENVVVLVVADEGLVELDAAAHVALGGLLLAQVVGEDAALDVEHKEAVLPAVEVVRPLVEWPFESHCF